MRNLFTISAFLHFLSSLHSSVTASESIDNSLLWGPYRPNLYFGMRARVPKSLSFGLMWTSVVDNQLDLKKLRHACEPSDRMAKYGWSMYDVRTGGIQNIFDPGNNLNLTTQLVKMQDDSGKGSWGVRVQGRFRDASIPRNASVIWYITVENDAQSGSNALNCQKSPWSPEIECQGNSFVLSSFNIQLPWGMTKNIPTTNLYGFKFPDEELWKAKDIFMEQLKTGALVAMDRSSPGKNLYYVERFFNSNFELFDILFASNLSSEIISSNALTKALELSRLTFYSRFQSVFEQKSPFIGARYATFSQSLLSNLLGGIGFFYGSSLVDTSDQSEYEEDAIKTPTHSVNQHTKPVLTKPAELFSCVPSRSAFPRGFLWDEGFHQLLILEWDLDLSIEILGSWLAIMDDSGWIAREYILGPEARSKVPYEFQIMYPHHANPPTLFLVAKAITEKLHGEQPYSGAPSKYLDDKELAQQLLQKLLVQLKNHYFWFRDTQKGNATSVILQDRRQLDVYRWRGRTSQHILPSGLDDYPRPQPPSLRELHVDAASWVGLMATVLRDMSKTLGRGDATVFESHRSAITASLERIHWSSQLRSYCDTTLGEEGFVHVCHQGYVSLMPFLAGLLEHDHLHMGDVLDLMRDERKLWSPHGLRSLSLSDEFYGKDENYWRGPVWININFLAVQRLLEVAQKVGPYQATARKIYTELRQNIVSTVYESWKSSGFAWEQYNPDTGTGQRTQHFTGWTALVVKIMAFPDLDKITEPHHLYISTKEGTKGLLYFQFLLLIGILAFVHINRSRFGRLVVWTQRGFQRVKS